MSTYADTSFLVSLYTLDSNSAAASKFMRSADLPVWFTALGDVEMMNALQLRVFRRELGLAEAKSAAALFRADTAAGVFTLKGLPITAFERAKKIARDKTATLGTRTIDLLHVSLALALHADALCTFDKSQRILAKSEGLKVPLSL